MIRKQLFPDYYTQFKIENRTEKDVEHMMHCVDALRQSTLCHADLATIPFQGQLLPLSPSTREFSLTLHT